MSRTRKTIKVIEIKDEVNRMLNESTCDTITRYGMCAVLEEILHSTNNYKGFGYLSMKHPGFGKPGHDDTRRCYY